MKKLFLTLAACAALLPASARATWDFGGTKYNVDTVYHVTTGPGMTTTALRIEGAQQGVNNTIKNNVFYTTIDLTNPDLELRSVQARDGVPTGTPISGNDSKGNPIPTTGQRRTVESVKSMGDRSNNKGNGQFIAGVNGDFFNMNRSPTVTLGHSFAPDAPGYMSMSDASWKASYAVVEGAKDIRLSETVKVSRKLNFPGGLAHDVWVDAPRGANTVIIYTPALGESTKTNEWGRECTMKLVSGSIAGGDAVFEITSECVGTNDGSKVGNMAIPADGYVLSGNGTGHNCMNYLKPGDRVSLSAPEIFVDGRKIDSESVIGGCPMILQGGEFVSESALKTADLQISHLFTNQARTAIGYNRDRTKLILLVVDAYKANVHTSGEFAQFPASTGFAVARMAQLMKNLDCHTAMLCDGGGSSQLYNKGLGIRNVPYGNNGYLRPVANGFFAVSTTPVDNNIAAIEVLQKDVKLSSGDKFTPTVYGYNKYGVLVNRNLTGFTLAVAPSLGSVSGTAFTAGSAAGSTHAVVTYGSLKCGVRIHTNGGGTFVTSGDNSAPLMVAPAYEPEEPMGVDREDLQLTERWRFVNPDYNDSWDATAPNWSNPDAVKAKSAVRFATARDSRFYTVDMKTMSIAEIDSKGNLTPKYKLPSLDGRKVNSRPDYYGTAISSDDAGNFLIGHLFTTTDSYRVWTVYSPATGKAKHFEFPLPTNSASNGRIDNIGRVVGDLTRDAYAYVAPKATGVLESNLVNMLHFEGDGDVDNLTASNSYSKGLYMAGASADTYGVNYATICQPKYATVDEMKGDDLTNTFFWYSKAPKGTVDNYTVDLFTFNNGNFSENYATNWNNYSWLNGFDTFLLEGKRYFVVSYADATDNTANSSAQKILIKDEKGNTAFIWNNPDYVAHQSGYMTVTAVPYDDKNVDIYVYNCAGKANETGAIAGAMLTLSVGTPADYEEPGPTTGISDIVGESADSDAPAVYYNLQGVEVKNPATGIYIVRRGACVTKEYIR